MTGAGTRSLTKRTGATSHDRAANECVVRSPEADRRRPAQCRIRRSRPRRRSCGHSSDGWAYDIHSFVDVAPLLASAGYRVILPYLRSYGATRFLSSETLRNGEQAAFAADVIDLMDALKIEKATLAGFDWEARTADNVVALWPERCKALVSVSGYLIGSQEAGKFRCRQRPSSNGGTNITSRRSAAGPATTDRRDFAKLIWRLASPKKDSDDATFDRTAASFDNPDHVAIVIYNYRWRLGLAEGEPKYDDIERRLAEGPAITVPVVTLEGDAQAAPHPEPSAYASKFTGNFPHPQRARARASAPRRPPWLWNRPASPRRLRAMRSRIDS